MLIKIFFLTTLISLQTFSSTVIPGVKPSIPKRSIEPWMQLIIDETVAKYKDAFKIDWTNDMAKVHYFNQAAEKISDLIALFETDKSPTFRESKRKILTNKDATIYITPLIGTAFRDYHIRFLWVKNSSGQEVDANMVLANIDDLEFLESYGSTKRSLILDGTYVQSPRIAFFTDKTRKLIYAFEAFQSPKIYLKHKPDLSKAQITKQ